MLRKFLFLPSFFRRSLYCVRSASFSSRNGPRFLLEKVEADAAHSSKERRRKEGTKVVLSSKNSAPTTASLPSNGGNNGVKLTDRHLPWATRAVCNPRPPVSYVVLVSDRLPPPPTPLYCIGSLTGGRTIAPLPPSFARALPPSVLLHCRGGECWKGRKGPYRPDTSSLASPLLFGHLVSKRKQNSGRSSGMVPEEKLQRGSFWTSRKGSSQSSTSKYSIHIP